MITEKHNELRMQPRRARLALLFIAAALTIATFTGKYLSINPGAYRPATKAGKYVLENYFILEFRLNTGSNFIVYFTAFILLTALAATFLLIALYKNSVKDPLKWSWFAFAALFLILSIYVTSALPDKHVKFYYESWTDRNGWFVFRWEATAVLLFALAIVFRKFFAHFEGWDKVLIPAAILLFFAGLFVMELFTDRFASFYKEDTVGMARLGGLGEFASFAGLILLLDALLRYAEKNLPAFRFALRDATPNAGEYVQRVSPRRVTLPLVVLAVILSILSSIGQALRLFPDAYTIHGPLQESLLDVFIYQFSLNTESNVATHFNTLTLLMVAALFFIIAALKIADKDKYRFGWFVLGLFALYLSVDEQCVLHEKLSNLFDSWSDYNGWLEYKWLIPALIGVGALAVLFIPFFFHLDHKFKILFVVSALMYFTGAFGGEMFSGRWASVNGVKNFTYSALTTVEELLELNGINLLIYSTLHYLQVYYGSFRLMVGAKKSSESVS